MNALPLPLLACGFVLAFASPALAQETPVDFGRDVQPLLARRCFSCHGPDKAESGLNMAQMQSMLGEAESGLHAIVPKNVAESELLRRVSTTDEWEKMPPEGKPLTAEEVALLRRWVEQGAVWQTHWAFVPPVPQTPPAVANEQWVRNPIDRFILAKLETAGLPPAPEADRQTLIRRAYFDLTGLPPSPAEVAAFVADPNPLAYEELIDRLLDSPRYGERWARHWLDLVRYAETNSYERDGFKPNAWRYRDYVIRSLNNDKPYDQFIREQLAGDELPQVTTETQIATGYYRLGVWDDEPADPLQAKFDGYDDLVKTTGQVFLGMTFDCARCHDHKIDPIPQKDYYSLLSFFAELTPYGDRGNQQGFNQIDISSPELRQRYTEYETAIDELTHKMVVIEQRGIETMSAPDQRKSEGPKRQELLDRKLAQHLLPDDLGTYTALDAERARLKAHLDALPRREQALGLAKLLPTPEDAFVMVRGNPNVPGDPVQPAFPTIFGAAPPNLPRDTPESPSGRRLALANWIASPDNMLTGRVIANRLWQHHFGRGIVRSTNNFGQLGTPPTHPELLDWLAENVASHGWTFKRMHRLMMTSATYRMASTGNEAALTADPENNLFWRFDPRRLGAEELRDTVLAVTGRLNLEMYGPWFYPTLGEEVHAGQSVPGQGWGDSSEEEQARRSIYIHVKRSLPVPLLAAFDFPETDGTCEARFRTTQPAQALSLMNGKFLNDEAHSLADRVRTERDSTTDRVERALELTLSRPATNADVERGLNLIATLKSVHGLDDARALDLFCLVVLNLNEFVYLD